MEDLATGRMSVAQIAQRILHRAADDDDPGLRHDFALVKRLLQEERDDIVARLPEAGSEAGRQADERYRKAYTIALRWIRNYTELNFRSLGSYTREELEAIAVSCEAF